MILPISFVYSFYYLIVWDITAVLILAITKHLEEIHERL